MNDFGYPEWTDLGGSKEGHDLPLFSFNFFIGIYLYFWPDEV